MKRFSTTYLFAFLIQSCLAQQLRVTLLKADSGCNPGRASVTTSSGTAPYSYIWSNGSVSDQAENLEPGMYEVRVSDTTMQDTSIRFEITDAGCEPLPESHFTPNGDGFNDSWDISQIGNFPDFELIVYNRWGQPVHRQENQYTPWDGGQLGLPLPDATYYYILFLSKSDKKRFVKGDVSILR